MQSREPDRGFRDIVGDLLGRREVKKTDIKVVNTSSPVKNRKGWYKWEIHLEAPEYVLSYIKSVKYILHPTFMNPERTVMDSKNRFKLESSGWGEVRVGLTITLKKGEPITKYHWLKLSGPTILDS